MSIEKNEKQDLNMEAFKKEFGDKMTDMSHDEKNLLGELGSNFDSETKDLKGAFNKTVDDKVNKVLSNLGAEDREKLKSLKEGMLKNPNDFKEIASVLVEINSLIGTENKENSIQAENFTKVQEDAAKEKSKLQEFKDEFSKMLTKSREKILEASKKSQELNKQANKEQEKSSKQAEASLLTEWPETLSEKQS